MNEINGEYHHDMNLMYERQQYDCDTIMDQKSEIEALKAQLVESEKQAYWQGFETGSNNPHQNIKMFYFEWKELIKSNQQGDSNGK